MGAPKVLAERRGRAFVVTINRAPVRNCVDGETAGLLHKAVEAFKSDDALDVMILTGAGETAFCAGADLKALNTLTDRPGAGESGPMGISRITDVGKPTIAAINGYSTAGGLELACWCDFRIADRTAQFGVLNRRWGVPLVDGGTQRLPHIVGMGNALYMIITGALIDAGHALRMGLVQEVVPPGQALDRALEVAGVLSTYPQTAMRNDRLAALASFDLPIDQGLRYEIEATRSSLGDPAMPAWLQRLPPASGRSRSGRRISEAVRATTSPTPSPPASPTATPVGHQRVWGDMDCDTAITLADMMVLLRYIGGVLLQQPDCIAVGQPFSRTARPGNGVTTTAAGL